MKRHYIYRVILPETGEFYWGVRSCNGEPSEDPYRGSMTIWKVDKSKLVKDYIKEFETRELANEAEHIVIRYFINKKMFPLNRNYANGKCDTLGFSFKDVWKQKYSIEDYENRLNQFKEKVSNTCTGEKNGMYDKHRRGEDAPFFGKTHSEVASKKISEKAKERLRDKTKHPMFGTHRYGSDNPFFGKTHSEESIAKMKAHWQRKRDEKQKSKKLF